MSGLAKKGVWGNFGLCSVWDMVEWEYERHQRNSRKCRVVAS